MLMGVSCRGGLTREITHGWGWGWACAECGHCWGKVGDYCVKDVDELWVSRDFRGKSAGGRSFLLWVKVFFFRPNFEMGMRKAHHFWWAFAWLLLLSNYSATTLILISALTPWWIETLAVYEPIILIREASLILWRSISTPAALLIVSARSLSVTVP